MVSELISGPAAPPGLQVEEIGKPHVPWPLCSVCIGQLGSGDTIVVAPGLHAHIDCVLERLREVVPD